MTTSLRMSLGLAAIGLLSACSGSGFQGGGSKKKIAAPAVQPAQAPLPAAPQPLPPSPSGPLGSEVDGQVVSPAPAPTPNVVDVIVPPSNPIPTPPPAPMPAPAPIPAPPPAPAPAPAPQPLPPPGPQPQPEDTAGQLQVQHTCFVNMEHGYHGTDENFIVQIVDSSGVVAAGYATIEAIRNGQASDGQGAYPGVVANYDLTYVRAGAASGSGTLNVCYSDPGLPPERGQCQQKQGQFGGDGERPTSVQGKSASWTVANGASGKPEFKVSGSFNLSTHHPVWAYAAPGKCFKDFQSPLVLDLNKNAKYDLVDVWNDKAKIRFDLMGTGEKIRTGWVKPGDALLALDLDGNGSIDSGLELFGEYTKGAAAVKVGSKSFDSGFHALGQYDLDKSGAIDAKDAIFGKLLVWRDQNQDGVSQKGELKSLVDVGVVSISLAYAKSGTKEWLIVENNEVRLLSTFTTKDGKEFGVADVWFKQRRHLEAQK